MFAKLVLCLILIGFGLSNGGDSGQNIWRNNIKVKEILGEYNNKKKDLSIVKCLECQYEKEISFKDFDNLKTLYLPYANFTESVPSSFLESLTNLENLDLSNAKGVPNDLTMKNLPKNLKTVQLNSIEIKDFLKSCKFENIEKLGLANTGIKQLELNDNCEAQKLEILDLSSNPVEKLDEINWVKAKRLLDLNLENCQSEKLPNFELLTGLEKINFAKNKIGNFSKIKHIHLVKLDLSSNELRTFEQNQFTSLNTLILSENKLESFLLDQEFPKLKHLKLNNNHLVKIELKSIQNVLEELNLSNNRLTEFGLKEVSYCPQLKTLNVLNNNLKNLDEFAILVKRLNIHFGQTVSNQQIEFDLNSASEHLIRNLTDLIRTENQQITKSLSAIENHINPPSKSSFSFGSIGKFFLYVILIGLFGYVAFMIWQNCIAQDRLIRPNSNQFEMQM